MNRTPYTPGPWKANDCGYVGTTPKDDDTGWTLVACPSEMDEQTSYVRLPSESEKKANAQLISAAPELLEACQELIRANDAYCDAIDNGGHEETHANRLLRAKANAKHAIAKALGQ